MGIRRPIVLCIKHRLYQTHDSKRQPGSHPISSFFTQLRNGIILQWRSNEVKQVGLAFPALTEFEIVIARGLWSGPVGFLKPVRVFVTVNSPFDSAESLISFPGT